MGEYNTKSPSREGDLDLNSICQRADFAKIILILAQLEHQRLRAWF